MTFLAPGAGIVGAALAVPVLVALYLLKLRRRPVRVSSVLLWEQAVKDLQANVPLRWIRPSWLLALQLLGLGCLLAAVARPAVPAPASVGARTIIVLDRSASMSAADGVRGAGGGAGGGGGSGGGGAFTRFDQARAAALEIVEALRRSPGRRPEGMIVGLGAEARPLTGFSSDVRELRDAVLAATPTDGPADAGSLARLVRALLAGGGEEGTAQPPATVVVISDGSLEGGEDAALPGGVAVRYVRCGPGPGPDGAPYRPDNLGIVNLSARRDAEAPATLRVFVRVVNAGPAPVEAALMCRLNDETARLLRLSVPAARAGADGAVLPGEQAGTFEIESSAGGLVAAAIAREDLLASDNAAALVVRPVTRARVLVVGPGDGAADPYRPARGTLGIDRFLLGVLEDLELAEVRTVDAVGYEALAAAGPDAGDAGGRGLDRYDLVVFDRVTPRSAPARPTLSFGAGMPGAALRLEPVAGPDVARAATRVLSWQRTHPVLRHAPLDALLVAPPMRMTIDAGTTGGTEGAGAAGGGAAAPPAATVTPLALGAGGPLIALVQEPGVRGVKRLVVGFDLVRTNWGPDVSFPVFVASALEFLTGRGDAAAGAARTTAEPVSIGVAPGSRSVRISGPEPATLDVPAGAGPGGAAGGAIPVVAWGVPERAGVYRAEGATPEDALIAVNVMNARESLCAVEPSLRLGGRTVGPGEDGPGAERPLREVWQWFVLAAVAVLTVEWFIYAARMRA